MQKLNRTTFETSRELEFFTEKELRMQIGHGRELWPAALLKELIDNALDACEMAGIAPCIDVEVGEDFFAVRDNGSGLTAETLVGSLDYLKRVSDKAFYVSPTRGQLGNALKVIWAAPFVAHGGHSRVEVWSHGFHHVVEVSVDRIAQKPVIEHTAEQSAFVKNGAFFKIHWPDLACSIPEEEPDSYEAPTLAAMAQGLIEGYAAFNPHATFRIGDVVVEATDPGWKKWRPDDPTSPHWYTLATFKDLIAAYVAGERSGGPARTARDLVSEFRGLSGTAKQKQATTAFKGAYLHDFVKNGDIEPDPVGRLLEAMKDLCKSPKPTALGIIGEDHLKEWMVRYADVSEPSIKYTKRMADDGLPYVLEVAFGIRNEGELEIISGLNWAPTLVLPAQEITRLLGQMRIDDHDPVTLIIHIACPRFEFVDRGKTMMSLRSKMEEDLTAAVKSVAKRWKKAKRQADKQDRISPDILKKLRQMQKKITIREAAFQVMERAYMKASGGGRLPANARQIYYAARPWVLNLTGEETLKSQYFTQVLLKDYMERFDPPWDVVFDARGHITEPHTGIVVGLGGLEVRDYVKGFTNGDFSETPEQESEEMLLTKGASLRYGAVLFLEKEGFDPLLKRARIAERFDVAIASTKGMPVSALCDLLKRLKEEGCPAYVVHDFDKSGFSIFATLRKGARGSQGTGKVIDLGFRYADIKGLEREPVSYQSDPTYNLRQNGATKAEIAILLKERVELNAMASDEFIDWLERKLAEHGIKKVIPDVEVLSAAYRRATYLQRIENESIKLRDEIARRSIEVPESLAKRVNRELKDNPELAWDEAVWRIAANLSEGAQY